MRYHQIFNLYKEGDNEDMSIWRDEGQKEYYFSDLKGGNMQKRYYEEVQRNRADGEYQRDFSRIMYASSFRRLQGKMQLLGIKPGLNEKVTSTVYCCR